MIEIPKHHGRVAAIFAAAEKLGASNSDIPGLWTVPGHPELTTNQLLNLAASGRVPTHPIADLKNPG